MAILLQYSKCLMELAPTYLPPKRIPKSMSKSPEIVLTNNDSNWIDIPEAEKLLPSLKTAMF